MTSRHISMRLAACAIASMALLSCSSRGAMAPTSSATMTRDLRASAYGAWEQCARDHGANIGTPMFDPDGSVRVPPGDGPLSSIPELRAAMTVCQPILSAAGFGPPGVVDLGPDALAKLQDQSRAFARCLQAMGVPLPDPTWAGGAITNWQPAALPFDLSDAKVQAAGSGCSQETGFDPLLAHAVRD